MNEPARALTPEPPPPGPQTADAAAKEPAASQTKAQYLVTSVLELTEQQAAADARLNGVRAWAETVKGQMSALHAQVASMGDAQSIEAQQIAVLAQQIAVLNQRTDPGERELPPPSARPHDAPDEVIGYRPSPEQLAQLFTALAEWQAAAPSLGKTGTANIETLDGKKASYDFATPGDVSALARTAGAQGLSHFHREVVLADYSVIRTYLVHSAGGFIWCDVPLLQKENKLWSPMQKWSAACTTAKRMGILSVMGILPADIDDDGNPTGGGGGGGGRQGGGRPPGGGDSTKPPPLPAANIRRIGAAAGPTGAANGTAPVSQPQPAAIRVHA
jgi:hypothetical protein